MTHLPAVLLWASPGGVEIDHLGHEMREGRTEALAIKSTNQAQGQQVSGSPSLDTNSLWVLAEKGGVRVPWGSPSG